MSNKININIVDDIKKADFIVDSHTNLSDEQYNGKNLFFKDGHQKSKPTKSKEDGGVLTIGLIVLFLIAPILTFKALPLWGKIIDVVFLAYALFSLFEPKIRKKDYKYLYQDKYKPIRIINYVLLLLTYLVYCRNCYVQYNNYKRYDYIGSDFTYALKIFTICLIITAFISAISRFIFLKISSKESTRDIFGKGKTAFIVALVVILISSITLSYGLKSKEGTSATGSMISLNAINSVDTGDSCVKIQYSIHNNTSGTIYRLKDLKVEIKDDNGTVVAKKTFETVDTGWWKGKTDQDITLIFNFPGEANETYFKSNSSVSLTTDTFECIID